MRACASSRPPAIRDTLAIRGLHCLHIVEVCDSGLNSHSCTQKILPCTSAGASPGAPSPGKGG
eukprot:4778384-Amphidinium_carterae.1